MTKSLGAGMAFGVVATVILIIAVWLTLVYTGAYNVAASAQHADIVRWTLDTTMHRSVANRAGGAGIPEQASEDLVAEGARHYDSSCAHCHGAPGSAPEKWSRGMRPRPPHLVEAAGEWSPEELHWIISNGIKMTGMPAFGEHHSAAEMVALTAFVSALPGLTADDYARLAGATREAPEPTEPAAGEMVPQPQNGNPVE